MEEFVKAMDRESQRFMSDAELERDGSMRAQVLSLIGKPKTKFRSVVYAEEEDVTRGDSTATHLDEGMTLPESSATTLRSSEAVEEYDSDELITEEEDNFVEQKEIVASQKSASSSASISSASPDNHSRVGSSCHQTRTTSRRAFTKSSTGSNTSPTNKTNNKQVLSPSSTGSQTSPSKTTQRRSNAISATASKQMKDSPSKRSRPAALSLINKSKREQQIWKGGSVFVATKGHELSLAEKKALEAKVELLGGSVATSGDACDLLVVPRGMKQEVLDHQILHIGKKKSSSSDQQQRDPPLLVTVEWLRLVVSKEEWIDPTSDASFKWKEASLTLRHLPVKVEDPESESYIQLEEPQSSSQLTWSGEIPSKYRRAAEAIESLPDTQFIKVVESYEEEEDKLVQSSSALDEFSMNSREDSMYSKRQMMFGFLEHQANASEAAASQISSSDGGRSVGDLVGLHGGQIYLKRRPIPKESLACQKLPQKVSKEKSEALNATLLSELGKMAELNEAKGDQWRAKSYSQAVAIIRTLDFEVRNSAQIRHRKGIGKNMAAHIDEILATGRMEKRVCFEADPVNQALVNLKRIYGVGEGWAHKLAKLGFTDIESIRTSLARNDPRLQMLTRAQLIGIKHYEDLQHRMPRAEMGSILNFIKQGAQHVYGEKICSELILEIVGSYRRGKPTSGDIDIIITSPSHPKERLSITPLVRFLQQEGLITDVLTISIDVTDRKRQETSLDFEAQESKVTRDSFFVPPINDQEPESETFMGVCCLPSNFPNASGLHRRIDIKSYPAESFAFALLYFTGSAHFNRSMRYFAKSLGFSLSDKGIYPCTRFSRDKVLKGASVVCYTEQDIFDALGLEYRAPKDRNCDEITVVTEKNEVRMDGSAAAGDDLFVGPLDDDEVEDDHVEEDEHRISSDDEWDVEGKLPPHYCPQQESLDDFLKRLSPSSYAVKSPWIRIWASELDFDALDSARSLKSLKTEADEVMRSEPNKSRLSLQEMESLCVNYGCLSGKWTLALKREEVDAAWGKICRFIADQNRNVDLITGAKVHSIAFRKRKSHLSVISVYNEDFRDKRVVKEILRVLRAGIGVANSLTYRSEAMSALSGHTGLYVSQHGLDLTLLPL